jgi:RNA polymerase sigma factor (sigma-70 family)
VFALPSIRKEWSLTQDALERLLARLDPDPDRAGEAYEDIRQSLITYFEFRSSPDPAKAADDTIDRVIRLLDNGREIFSENPASFFLGVARNLVKEGLQSQQRIVSYDDISPAAEPRVRPDELWEREELRESEERRAQCLESCLASLSADARDLILRYYLGEKTAKIAGRRQLAVELGVPLNALRIRAFRIREKLERCHRDCCEGELQHRNVN